MHFGQFVRHSVVRFVVLDPPFTPNGTQVEGYTHAQFIPQIPVAEIGSKKGSKNHNIAFSYRGRAFQTPLFRQSLSLRVRLKATHTHSLFPNSGDEIQRSIICCTYVRDCGVTLRKDVHMVRLLNIGSQQSSIRAKTNQKPIRMN